MTVRLLLLTSLLALTALAADNNGKWPAAFNTQVGEQKYAWDRKAEGLPWIENLKFEDVDLRLERKAVLSGINVKITRNDEGIAMEEATRKRTD
jgi:hypothetical protein